eukprot:TRINITY_DN28746_c0_g1_i1.p1 TRINITY_DN28746_c0_g1~~TRINITY_DN28746_c0_g1_i1.p1  ORF type:complete len:350 (+),score=132.04 TRINITY_DN28746_c0_g1_i1:72-1052(+)
MAGIDALITALHEPRGPPPSGAEARAPPPPAPRPKFDLGRLAERRPELSGFFQPPVDLPVAVADGYYACMWDPDRRALCIAEELPAAAPRTAVELCSVAQYAALARDDRGHPDGDKNLLYRVAAQYNGWAYAKACLSKAELSTFAQTISMREDQEFFAEWADIAYEDRVARIAAGLARWDDPDPVVALLAPLQPLLEPSCAAMPAGDPDARPLVPSAWHNLEAARQRLLRAATEGQLDAALRSQQKSLHKRAARLWPSEIAPPPAEPPAELPPPLAAYFAGPGAKEAAAALRAAPGALRGAALGALLALEAAVHDVQRMHVGGAGA